MAHLKQLVVFGWDPFCVLTPNINLFIYKALLPCDKKQKSKIQTGKSTALQDQKVSLKDLNKVWSNIT